jgi:hypothetical protein
MEAIITLTSDFGACGTYAAAMKGVILSINPKATIIDICHTISPQNIIQAAFIVGTTYHYFPPDSIHLVVIDPGVGSKRRGIILKTTTAFFVAPDNGVLSYVIRETSPQRAASGLKGDPCSVEEKELGPGLQAISLTEPRFWRHPISSTFHGRDIFAPVAAHLSLGVPLEEFGKIVPSLLAFPLPQPQLDANGGLIGHIIHIDHFGNLITDVRREDLPSAEICLEICGWHIDGLSTSYAEGGELLALIDSSENLEVAAKDASAAKLLGARIGDEVRITTPSPY